VANSGLGGADPSDRIINANRVYPISSDIPAAHLDK